MKPLKKAFSSTLICALIALSALSFGCKKEEACEHAWGDWVVDQETTCTEDGAKHRACSVCGETETETTQCYGHYYSYASLDLETYYSSTTSIYKSFCVNCGQEKIVELDAQCKDCDAGDDQEFFVRHQYVNGKCEFCGRKEPGQNGQTLTFGSYPQSAVTDESLIKTLNGYISQYPKEGETTVGGWAPFVGYDQVVNGFFWYQDVTHSGSKYRAVYRIFEEGKEEFF